MVRFIRETLVAGRTIMQSFRPVGKAKKGSRAPRVNPTPEAVRKVNLRNAIWHLLALLNANFDRTAYHAVLTYAGQEPSAKEAKKIFNSFIRRVREYCKRRGVEFKWIMATEYKSGRLHHHLICSGVDVSVIFEKWQHGNIEYRHLDKDGNYKALAEYIVKETEETFREKGSVWGKRYSRSRNLVDPTIFREEISPSEYFGEPKACPNYAINEDSVEEYVHPIFEMQCRRLVQVSLTKIPSITDWGRGKHVRREKHYTECWPKQLDFWELEDIEAGKSSFGMLENYL